ncbi:MAG: tRNA uridine-5-carboxymethylaminomethyl(34) synthesis GTPase MnmE [Clostridiales Family XIII bacterium]|jgi:tRNA modification GTPase|nr:tRNA uridine-5-carboxymethylaminomethyl(34) synthesis GTPase MnmE [Clostridiales Family XIII bacterium]
MPDTIAAISTPPGEGGIGIVRMSGPAAAAVLARIFRPGAYTARHGGDGAGTAGETAQPCFADRHMRYGHVADPESGALVDETLAVFMKAPRTYTGEDVAEIHCHGGIVPLRNTLLLMLREGARPAEPGEFTKRAFLNGRLDLAQAEAVIDLIQAKTDTCFDAAIQQLDGSLSHRLKTIRDGMTDLLVDITVNLDYPEEDIEEITYESLVKRLSSIGGEIEKLRDSAITGQLIRNGLRVVISGKPNVGKSSLLNALLKDSRAIVTEIPGTTRDVIEEGVSIRGVHIRLTDTAGIRDTQDPVERIGVEKSKDAFNNGDLILLVVDACMPLDADDAEILRHVGTRPVIALLNKIDLARDGSVWRKNEDDLRRLLPGARVLRTSMKSGEGLDLLEEALVEVVYRGEARQKSSLLVTNARHADLLERAGREIREALEMAGRREALDFTEVNVRQAWQCLGEITGEAVGADVIDEVFARFCLGK